MLTVYMVALVGRVVKGAKQGSSGGLLGVSSVFHDPSVHDITSTGRYEDDIGATLGDFRATQGDIYASCHLAMIQYSARMDGHEGDILVTFW